MASLIEVIINANSGPDSKGVSGESIASIFKKFGAEVHINLAKSGEDISLLAQKAVHGDCKTVVAGGGDGTISAVAAHILDTDKVLGVLPLGTLNHFAKDLHIPLEIEAAVKVIVAGHSAKIDVGEVNGKVFINNSSIGVYPDIVRGREHRQRLGYGKWSSLARSAMAVLRRNPLLAVQLNVNGEELVTRTPFVFIGNNEYEMEGFNIGGRARIDDGHLSLYMTSRTGRFGLLQLAFLALFGSLGQAKDFVSLTADEVWIKTRHKQLRVATDGEVTMLPSPLNYRIRQGALNVIIPTDLVSEDSD